MEYGPRRLCLHRVARLAVRFPRNVAHWRCNVARLAMLYGSTWRRLPPPFFWRAWLLQFRRDPRAQRQRCAWRAQQVIRSGRWQLEHLSKYRVPQLLEHVAVAHLHALMCMHMHMHMHICISSTCTHYMYYMCMHMHMCTPCAHRVHVPQHLKHVAVTHREQPFPPRVDAARVGSVARRAPRARETA